MTTPPAVPEPFVAKFPDLPPPVPPVPAVPPLPASQPFDPAMLAVPALIFGLGLILGVIAFILWKRSQRIDPDALFRVLATQPENAGTAHVEFPPVDLHRPIAGEEAWRAIRIHANDAAYLAAVETMRRRFEGNGQPMALATLLRETMATRRIGFREAMMRLAAQGGAPPSGLALEHGTQAGRQDDPGRDASGAAP